MLSLALSPLWIAVAFRGSGIGSRKEQAVRMDRRRSDSHCRHHSSHKRPPGSKSSCPAISMPGTKRRFTLGSRLSEELVLRSALRWRKVKCLPISRRRKIDAQLTAAKAKLHAASAAVKVRDAEAQFAKTTYERWRDSPRVRGIGPGTGRQNRRNYQSGMARLNAAKADMAVAQADVDRPESLQGFKSSGSPPSMAL